MLVLLITIEIVLQFTKPGTHLVDGPFDNLVVSGIVGFILASVTVRAAAAIVRNQARIMEYQRALAKQVQAVASEPDAPADLPPDNVLAFEVGRRLGRQEHRHPS